MIIARREKTLHRLFLISTWIKGAAGVLETLAGVAFFFIATKALETFVVLLTAPELAEDPNDWIAIHLARAVHQFSSDTAFFAGAALVSDCLHCLPMLSLRLHPFHLASPTNDCRSNRGLLDLARVSNSQASSRRRTGAGALMNSL